MGEWNYIILFPLGAALFAIGGTGFKWVRRYALPVLLMLVMWINGIIWWKFLAVGVLSGIAYCLPYGDSTPWWQKSLVIASYFAVMLFLGFTWLMVICPATVIWFFWVSQQSWGTDIMTWKMWECTTGALIGATLARLIT